MTSSSISRVSSLVRVLPSAWIFASTFALVGACSHGNTDGNGDGGAPKTDAATSADLAFVTSDPLILARPYESQVPTSYDGTKAVPLLVFLHGYRSTPFLDNGWFEMNALAESAGYLLALPVGSKDANGFPHWNDGANPGDTDDVAYLDALIKDMSARYRVDARRVFVMGHSNGGGMTYRYACARPETVAAAIPIAGTVGDLTTCKPAALVSMLHVVGSVDGNWQGSTRANVTFWAAHDGCGVTSDTSAAPLDLDVEQPGAETTVERWTGCMNGTDIQLFVVGGANHHPRFGDKWIAVASAWLSAHGKP